ncbi:nucleoporin SEH1-like [Mizuhopecten yessoensis]|uniref:nucleoporin SEH1-like n=1 Tax=Mizuhopecten yessoensis TaxID=6573 RepID=UPI000B45CAA2|nr:nucleoporin SEH1-like [Mizuhopecten yessoensis]
MFVTRHIPAEHKDLIHDVSYDFHGNRMATCSSDQTVKVWDLGEDGQWNCTASWRTHSGSVWRVTWAHPEFGQVIATCSFDRTAAVWEEIIGEYGKGNQSNWVKRSSLVDSRTSVTDVKFAPKHLGLQLATCSADGTVRIYEAPDVMNLSQWSLQNDIQTKLSCSCLSWNMSRMHPPMIAVGSDDASPSGGGKVQIYEYNDKTRKWVKVETINIVTDPVHDIAFAPNLGRSYHLLAVASKDLKVISLTPLSTRDAPLAANQVNSNKFTIKRVAEFTDHESEVWRICWNVIGTVLASSGDDGCVRLWKANYLDSWRCMAVLKGDGTHQQDMDRLSGLAALSQQPSFNSNAQTDMGVSGSVRSPPPVKGNMNIKRNSGWPNFNTKKDQGKMYY